MDSQRNLLVIGLLVVSFLLWQQWNADKAPKPQTVAVTQTDSSVPAASNATDVPGEKAQTSTRQLIKLSSDQLELLVDTQGGDIVDAKLLQHTVAQDSNDPFPLLMDKPGRLYVAQSGLIGRDGPDSRAEGRPVYTTTASEFRLADGQDKLVVPFSWTNADGVTFTKEFTLTRGKFTVDVDYKVNNSSSKPLEMQFYGQLKQTIAAPADQQSHALMASAYRGAAYSSTENRYKKETFDNIKESNLNVTTEGGWVGMLQHYFVAAWAGEPNGKNNLYTRAVSNNQDAIIGLKEPMLF